MSLVTTLATFAHDFEDARRSPVGCENTLIPRVPLEEALVRVGELLASDGRRRRAYYPELGLVEQRRRLPDAPTRKHLEKGPARIRPISIST